MGFRRINVEKWLLIGSILLFVSSRIINLDILPIVTDEAIYLRWAQVVSGDRGQVFLPLTDGKTPLFIWTVIPLLTFIDDPLIAGRMFAAVLGMFGFFGIYILARLLFSVRTAAYACLLWTVTPFILMYDRLALVESMLLTFQIWLLILCVKFIQTKKVRFAVGAGCLLGAAFLTKPSALQFIPMLPVLILLAPGVLKKSGFYTGLLLLMFAALSLIIPLKLSPHFQAVFLRTQEYTYPLYELMRRPLEIIGGNLSSLVPWLVANTTWPILLWALLGIVFGIRLKMRQIVVLVSLVFTTMSILAVTGKVLYPRYLLGLLPSMLLLCAYGIERTAAQLPRILFPFILGLSLIPALDFDRHLLFTPSEAPFVHVDRWQYLSGWASGHGVKEYAQYLIKVSNNRPLLVGVEGRFGNPYNGIQVYLAHYPHIDVVAVDHELAKVPARLQSQAFPTYLIANESRLSLLPNERVETIRFTPKPRLDNNTPQDGLWLLRIRSEHE